MSAPRVLLDRLASLLFPDLVPAATLPPTPRPAIPPGLDAEACVAAADAAMGEEDWGVAVAWYERARALAPTSGRICADLAFALSRCGRHDEALTLYDEAARHHPAPGEPLFHAAMLAHALGRRADADARLRRALAADPGLARELDADLVPRATSRRRTRDEKSP